MNDRRIALLMGLVAASLAVMSILHLAGAFEGRTDPGAGTAEAIIGVVLVAGALVLVRNGNRPAAVAALAFAIAGFPARRELHHRRRRRPARAPRCRPPRSGGRVALAIRPARTGGAGRAGFRPGR
jgi:uncharacterized membrane protein